MEIHYGNTLNHSETPGLEQVTRRIFQRLVYGKNDEELTVIKSCSKDNEIQAISGATITKAVTSGAILQ